MLNAVVDPSVVIDLLFGRVAAERAGVGTCRLHAPAHLDPEILHVLMRLERRGEIDAERAEVALERLRRAPIRRVGVVGLTAPAWLLRHNLSGYDAVYVALARRLACPLFTSDAALAAAPGLDITVTVVR